jgi:hypothetical protein
MAYTDENIDRMRNRILANHSLVYRVAMLKSYYGNGKKAPPPFSDDIVKIVERDYLAPYVTQKDFERLYNYLNRRLGSLALDWPPRSSRQSSSPARGRGPSLSAREIRSPSPSRGDIYPSLYGGPDISLLSTGHTSPSPARGLGPSLSSSDRHMS